MLVYVWAVNLRSGELRGWIECCKIFWTQLIVGKTWSTQLNVRVN